jgi:hypothetical protein
VPRIDRYWRRLASQDTARTNAAEASRKLRDRRDEHEEVDAYFRSTVGMATDSRNTSPTGANWSP